MVPGDCERALLELRVADWFWTLGTLMFTLLCFWCICSFFEATDACAKLSIEPILILP